MFQQVLAALPAKPPKVHLGPGCQRYLRDHGVPESLITTLDECTYAGDIPIGRLWLAPLGELDVDNQREENLPCIADHRRTSASSADHWSTTLGSDIIPSTQSIKFSVTRNDSSFAGMDDEHGMFDRNIIKILLITVVSKS